jgi:hypothetical protein
MFLLNAFCNFLVYVKLIPEDQEKLITELRFDAGVGLAKCFLQDIPENSPKNALEQLRRVFCIEGKFQLENPEKLYEALITEGKAYLELREPENALQSFRKAKGLNLDDVKISELNEFIQQSETMRRRHNELDAQLAARMLRL